jgi:hypothetical protein
MAKPFRTWTVLPHGKLTRLDEGLLTVVGELHMPTGDFPRRMTVASLADGRLVIYSAIALDDDEMTMLERYGMPSFLIVPNAIHRMDARGWKERYPDIRVIAPAGARAKVSEIVPVDATTVDFGDPRVHFVTVRGTKEREAALLVQRPSGTTLVVNDIIWNVDHRPGVGGWLLKAAGFTGGGPKIPFLVAKKAIEDKNAFREQLELWAQSPNLRRIVVSHGDVVTEDAPAVLRKLSARLAA